MLIPLLSNNSFNIFLENINYNGEETRFKGFF